MSEDQIDIPVFDGHNDTLLHIANLDPEDDWEFGGHNDDGALDLVRAAEGGMIGGLFAIMTPPETGDDLFRRDEIVRTEEGYKKPIAPPLDEQLAGDFAAEMLGLLEALEQRYEQRFGVAESVGDIRRFAADGRLAAVVHFEGAEPVGENLERLEEFYDRGLRSLGPVWSRPNAFGQGVPFRFPSTPDVGSGLTEAGERLIEACNELGIVVDCAHLNEAGFWDVAARTEDPMVVSHACCHAISPSARNLTNRQIDAIGESGGVVGINFFVADLREDGKFRRDTPIDQVVCHIDHVVERIGVDHVAFGSDFDGARTPRQLSDAAAFPRLIRALSRHGYDEEAIRKIAGENWLRVLEEIWGE